jgi:recombination protein RecA
MKCEGYKTRFTKPFQSVTIEVPYESGIDPFNGLLEVAKDLGVVKKAGSWYTFGTEKFQAKNSEQFMEDILVGCEAKREEFLEAIVNDDMLDRSEEESSTKKRKAKVSKTA